jgi:hypothetical protein
MRSREILSSFETAGDDIPQGIEPDQEKQWWKLTESLALPSNSAKQIYTQTLIGAMKFRTLETAPTDLLDDCFLVWRERLGENPIMSRGFTSMSGMIKWSKFTLRPELLAVYYQHEDPFTVKEEQKRQNQSAKSLFSSSSDNSNVKPRPYNEAFKYAKKWNNMSADKQNAALFISRMFSRAVERMARNRQFCSTRNRQIGWVPEGTRTGDVVCVLDGARVPFILRAVPGREGAYTLVGEAYMHGLMQASGTLDQVTKDVIRLI